MNQIKVILTSSVNRVTRKAPVTCLQHAFVANQIFAIQCIARDVYFTIDLSSARIKPLIFIISHAFRLFFIIVLALQFDSLTVSNHMHSPNT